MGRFSAWFFINVALVVLAVWLLLKFQFGVGLEDVFAEQLRVRVEPRAELVATELRQSPQDEWPGILTRTGKELGVRLSVITLEGVWTEGAGLPAPLRASAEKIAEKKGRQHLGQMGAGPERGGPGPGGRRSSRRTKAATATVDGCPAVGSGCF